MGVLSSVFHLSNGLWSFGIRWGIWTSPAAMRRAGQVCVAFGIGLSLISVAATFAPRRVDTVKAKEIEDTMYEAKVASHDIDPDENKRTQAAAPAADDAAPADADGEAKASEEKTSDAKAGDSKGGESQAGDAAATPVNSGAVVAGN